jgi:hypothetical protein
MNRLRASPSPNKTPVALRHRFENAWGRNRPHAQSRVAGSTATVGQRLIERVVQRRARDKLRDEHSDEHGVGAEAARTHVQRADAVAAVEFVSVVVAQPEHSSALGNQAALSHFQHARAEVIDDWSIV